MATVEVIMIQEKVITYHINVEEEAIENETCTLSEEEVWNRALETEPVDISKHIEITDIVVT